MESRILQPGKENHIHVEYKAVLFDLDGTLLDTLQDLADVVNKGLSFLGFPPHEIPAYKYFIGDGREEMAARALPGQNRDPATLKLLVDYINEQYSQHWADHTQPYPGIPELLDGLTARNIKLTILSNKPESFTKLMVSRLLARWHFEAVLGASPSVPKKPDCTAALKIAQQLNISPSQFLYLGDSDIDMKTAIRANMYPVGALWGFRTAEELKAGGAKAMIVYPTDLLRFLRTP